MKRSIGAKTIVFPTPVFVIGTYDKDERPNVMVAAWAGIACSDPPCVSISLREATYTYGNIMDRKAFTVNITPEQYIEEADYFGIVSGRNEEKLAATGLAPVRGDFVDAPYIEEFPLVLECELVHSIKLGLHTQFVGQIKDVKAEESVLAPDGTLDITKIKPVLFDPATRSYYATGKYLSKAFSIGKIK